MDSPDDMAFKAYITRLVDAYQRSKINQTTLDIAADLFKELMLREWDRTSATGEQIEAEKIAEFSLNSGTHFSAAAAKQGKF